MELELFRQGQFVIQDEEKEDAEASTDAARVIPPDISAEVFKFFLKVISLKNIFFYEI